MTNHKIQFVGTPCGQHGNYIFYKAFKYVINGKQKILTLGEFFLVKFWEEEEILSIGEPQLIWEDKTAGQTLVSLRVYFLPENTPEGRNEEHGEDEVVSLSEKVVLRADDVINIMRAASGLKWDTGLKGVYGSVAPDMASQQESPFYTSPLSQSLDVQEIMKEKKTIGDTIESNGLQVIVLNYDCYCRIRALLKRLEGVGSDTMKSKLVRALGGFIVPSKNSRMVFCKDVFEYPELEGHELLCNHLAPKLQGRPRKKKTRQDSESESSETSEDQQRPRIKAKPTIMTKSSILIPGLTTKHHNPHKTSSFHPPKVVSSSSSLNSVNSLSSHIKSEFSTPALDRLIEVDFMSKLYKFMKDRNTAITRLPYIGFKQLNLFELFTRVQKLGGYEIVCQKKIWKHLYEELAGKQQQPQQQNAAQILHSSINGLRRHYERLLLPYENFLLQEQRRLLGIDAKKSNILKPQKLLNKNNNNNKHNSQPSKHPSSTPTATSLATNQRSSQQQQSSSSLNNLSSQVKVESSEPSVSILQPLPGSPAIPPVDPIGASFQVADGGSTTITLVPASEESQAGNPADYADRPSIPVQSLPTGPPVHQSPYQELTIPKLNSKKDISNSADLSKRPEITITPIPRSLGSLGTLGQGPLTSLQLADLMSLNVNLTSTLGVSALQDLAKIAERYDKATAAGIEHPPTKKRKADDGSTTRVNGANHRNSNDDSTGPNNKRSRSPTYPVPDLLSADLLRQMSALEANSKFLLPAHQSTKTINALAALLPQTSIFPAPAPAAHQQHSRLAQKPQTESTKPEQPVFQSLSVYSQSKNIYGKPMPHASDSSKDSKERSSSPEIEILDLRMPNENKSSGRKRKSKHDRGVDIELLDLTTRRDITVSAIPKPGTSRNSNSAKIPPPQVSIKATNNGKSSHRGAPTSPLIPGLTGFGGGSNNQTASLVAALASQGIPSSLASMGMANPALLHYLMSSGMKPPAQNAVPHMFPYMDPTTLASYYSLLPPGLLGPSSPQNSSGNNSAAAAAAHQAAVAAQQLAQLNSLGLTGLPGISPEAMASLGIYKNYLPHGSLPAPHFLSGLMSPGAPAPPTSK